MSFRLQCTAFHAGMLRVFFQPLDAEPIAEGYPSRVSASVCQGFNMVAGSTQVGTLKIPFVHPQAFLECKDPTIVLGTINIMVFNSLRVGTVDAQAHQCTVSTYACIQEPVFKVLDPTTDNGPTGIILQGGLMSKVTNNNISLAAGATYVSHGDSDNFEGKTSNKVSGLDKPNIGLEAPVVRRRFAPDLATAANVGYKTVLGLYAGECDLLEPVDVGTKLDEMDLSYLMGKESLSDTFTMSRVTAPGTILAKYQITPCRKVAQALPGSTFQPDLFEFTVMPFEMWRGDIIMVVEMLGSSVNTARIAVCTHFGATEEPLALTEAMGQYAHVFDTTAETNRFEVVLPYTSRFEWMRVLHGTVPAGRTIEDYSTGLVTIRAISRLTYTPAVTDEIDINVYFRAGDNFEVKWLGAGLSDVEAYQPPFFELQAGDLVDGPTNDQSDEVVASTVAAPSGTAVVQAPENRGHYRSINDLIQRSTKSIINPSDIFDLEVTDLLNENPFFEYYSNIFKVWKGGATVVFASRGDTALTFIPDATINGVDVISSVGTTVPDSRNGQRGVPLVNCAGRNISLFTFLVNYVSPMKFMIFNKDKTLPVSYRNYGRVFGQTTNPDSTASCGAYIAASDELRMSYLFRVPTLRITTVNNYFPHTPQGLGVPATVNFVKGGPTDDGLDLRQEDVTTFQKYGSFAGAISDVSFSVTTEFWTPEMFEDYAGIVIPAGSLFARFGSVTRTWRGIIPMIALPSTLNLTQGLVATIYAYDLVASPSGPEALEYIDGRGVAGIGSQTFTVDFKDNLGRETDYALLSGLGEAGDNVYVPDTTSSAVVLSTGPQYVFENRAFFEWDFKNSLAFIPSPAQQGDNNHVDETKVVE